MDLVRCMEERTASEDQSANEVSGRGEARGGTESKARVASGRCADKAKHKTGYDSRWEAEHPWLFHIDGEGMYCKLCRKFDTKNCQNQLREWNREACTTLCKDVLARHEASMMHREALGW